MAWNGSIKTLKEREVKKYKIENFVLFHLPSLLVFSALRDLSKNHKKLPAWTVDHRSAGLLGAK